MLQRTLAGRGISIVLEKVNLSTINLKIIQNIKKNFLQFSHFLNISANGNKILVAGTMQLSAEASFGGHLRIVYSQAESAKTNSLLP